MSAREAPFGTDLQPKVDIKIVGGKVIPYQVYSKKSKDESKGKAEMQVLNIAKDNIRKGFVPREHKSHDRSVTYPLPVISSMSAPPKRGYHNYHHGQRNPIDKQSMREDPSTSDLVNIPTDVLQRVCEQVQQVRYWKNNIEDLARSCGRLDFQHTGCVPLPDLHRALESYGFFVDKADLSTLVSASESFQVNGTAGTRESSLVLYRNFCRFLQQIVVRDSKEPSFQSPTNPPYACHRTFSNDLPQDITKTSTALHNASQHFSQTLNTFKKPLHQQREHLHTCPSRLQVVKAKRKPHSSTLIPLDIERVGTLSEAEKGVLSRETARLLVKVEYVLGQQNWGNPLQMKRLEEALAAKDRERTGYIEIDEVREACLAVGLPLADHLLLGLLSRCIPNTVTNLVRWIAFTDLLYKACPLSVQQALNVPKKTYPVLGDIHSSQPTSKPSRLLHTPSRGYQEGARERCSSSGGCDKDVEDVMLLVSQALNSCANQRGLIEKDEAYRIVKNYSAVYPGVLSVDVLLFKDFCEKCTILDEGKPLIHTNDVIKYLRDCS